MCLVLLESNMFVINTFTASGNLSSDDNLYKQFGPRSGPTEFSLFFFCTVK